MRLLCGPPVGSVPLPLAWLCTAGHLLNFLAGSEVPRLSVADVRVSPGMPAAICKGSVCDGGKHPEVLSQSRSGQPCVFPQATLAPSPGP